MPHEPEKTDIHAVLARLERGYTLDESTSEAVFTDLLSGGLDDTQIGALLALIQTRSPTVDELTGAARVMRRHVTPVRAPAGDRVRLIDTCGTGGAPKTFNISTAAAIVAAGARPADGSDAWRVVVAKHGNRSRTGRGSAEVLAALGVNIDATPETQSRCLEACGVCFCFAIHHHPAMRYAAGPRRSLGFPTIFNLLGPLTNPAGARRQFIGVWERAFVDLVAQTLARLGVDRAMVMHSDNGLDELTVSAPAVAAVVEGELVRTIRVDPADYGLTPAPLEALRVDEGGGVEAAAELIRAVLEGQPGPTRDTAALSAGGALFVAGVVDDLGGGIALAQDAISSGRARATLEQLAASSCNDR